MTTLTLLSDLEELLVEEARRQGTTPELLAVDCLRKSLVPALAAEKPGENATLFDFLSGYIGTVGGTTEAQRKLNFGDGEEQDGLLSMTCLEKR